MSFGTWQSLNAPIPGTEDSNHWDQARYYQTFHFADINNDGQDELLFRGPFGLFTYSFDRTSGQWFDLNAGDLGMSDTNHWDQPQYYSTIRLADINFDGQAELIMRGAGGLLTYGFDLESGKWVDLNAGNLGMTDIASWDQPQYYSTMRLADIDNDGQAELMVRGAGGLLTYAFDDSHNKWFSLNTGDLGMNDTASWDQPQYYSTIWLADINNDKRAELMARGVGGLLTYALGPAGKWVNIGAGDLGMSDTASWNKPQYYNTMRLADINNDGQAELLARGSGGLLTYGFDLNSGKWVNLGAGDLGMSDTASWDQLQYYSTMRLADINNDKRAEIIVRGAGGLLTYAFDSPTSKWINLGAGNLGLSDTASWNKPQYYETFHFGDINKDGFAEFLARGSAGVGVWRYTLP